MSYWQGVGRAGRDGQAARAVWYSSSAAALDNDKEVLESLRSHVDWLRAVILSAFIVPAMDTQLLNDLRQRELCSRLCSVCTCCMCVCCTFCKAAVSMQRCLTVVRTVLNFTYYLFLCTMFTCVQCLFLLNCDESVLITQRKWRYMKCSWSILLLHFNRRCFSFCGCRMELSRSKALKSEHTGRQAGTFSNIFVLSAEGRNVCRIVVMFVVTLVYIRLAHVLMEGSVKSSTDWSRHLAIGLDRIWRVVNMCVPQCVCDDRAQTLYIVVK